MLVERIFRILIAAWVLSAAGPAAAQTCWSPPVATDDDLEWTGVPQRLEVRSNDYDPDGRPLTVVNVEPLEGGQATPTGDHLAVYFVPANGATKGRLRYTIRNSDGQTAYAYASLGVPNVTPQPAVTFSYTCDGLYCTFRSAPSTLADVRAYSWTFRRVVGRDTAGNPILADEPNTLCQKPEWHAQSFSCTFASAGERAVFHRVLYHTGDVAQTSPYPQLHTITSTTPVVDVTATTPRGDLYVETRMKTDLSNPLNHHYKVDWGDGTVETVSPGGTTVNDTLLTHTYATEGTQTVTIIHQESGAKYWDAINLVNKTPTPVLNASLFGQQTWTFTVPFTGVDEFSVRSAPGPYGWEWPPNAPTQWELDYGDGEVVKFNPVGDLDGSMQFTHDYPARRGVYKARLIVTDHLGATGIAEQEVNVTNARPEAKLSWFCENGYCRFDASQSRDDSAISKYRFVLAQRDGSGQYMPAFTADTTNPVWDHRMVWAEAFRIDVTVYDDSGAASVASAYGQTATHTEVPLVYYATEPCSLGSATFGAGWASFTAKGVCGIPNEAEAAAVNVRLSSPAYPGNLSVDGRGPVMMNFNPSRPQQSSFAILPFTFFATKAGVQMKQYPPAETSYTAGVAMDVTGYFRRATGTLPQVNTAAAAGPLWFRSATPCALVDTRKEPPGLSAGAPRLFDLRNRCSFGPEVAAAPMQMAVIAPATNGSVTAYSAASPLPAGRSSLDVLAGRNISGLLFSRVSNGMLNVASTAGTANAALTAPGVFTRAAGERYVATTPCRILDTRGGIGAPAASGEPVRFQVAGNCGVSRYATAVLLHAAVVGPNGPGNLQLYASDADAPEAYAITNFLASETVGSTAIVPLGGSVDLAALVTLFSGGTTAHVIVDIHGYFDGRRNVAAAANGATASGSDPADPRFPASAMIDGDRTGKGWGNGTGGWADSSPSTSPDFVGVQFAAPARIDQVDLFTLPDDYVNARDPIREEHFTKWGLTAFDVGYWDAVTQRWVYFQVTGNTSRWSRLIFPRPVVTDKLSIVARAGCPSCTTAPDGLGGPSRIVEIEAYEVPPGTP